MGGLGHGVTDQFIDGNESPEREVACSQPLEGTVPTLDPEPSSPPPALGPASCISPACPPASSAFQAPLSN